MNKEMKFSPIKLDYLLQEIFRVNIKTQHLSLMLSQLDYLKMIKILRENGCGTIYWKTGHSHIKRKVNKEKALAGFEKSGHFFFNQPLGYGYDDGINSAIQVCHLIISQNKKMTEIIRSLPTTYQTPTMAPYCNDEEKYKVVDEMVKEIKKLKDTGIKIDNQKIVEVLTINGVRFSLEDGSWGLIRASSNKPLW